MSGSVMFISRIRLPNGEGGMVLLVEETRATKVPGDTEIQRCIQIHEGLFTSEHHEPMRYSRISPEKSIIFCPECGLRIEFPPSKVKTAEELDTFIYLMNKSA